VKEAKRKSLRFDRFESDRWAGNGNRAGKKSDQIWKLLRQKFMFFVRGRFFNQFQNLNFASSELETYPYQVRTRQILNLNSI
jgi:hypothetical protein